MRRVARDFVVVERLAVNGLDARNLVEDVVAQGGPVEALFAERPAEAARVVKVFGEVCAIDEQLLGHAAANDAGSAGAVFLGDADTRAMPGGERPKVLFCTIETRAERIAEALSAGADEYVMKPFDGEILQSKLA